MKPKIYLRDKIYVPEQSVDLERIEHLYVRNFFDEQSCRKCDHFDDRPSYACSGCSAYVERISLHGTKVIKGENYISLPIGDRTKVQRKAGFSFADHQIVDKRTAQPLTVDLRLTAELRTYQDKVVGEFLAKGFGMIVAPPRSGKSIMSVAAAIGLGLRILYIASQHEFLSQIEDHYRGNVDEGIPECTNINALEQRHGKKLCGFLKKEEDYKTFQVAFIPYQSLINESGKRRLRLINENFGTLIIDEVHKGNATHFAKTISSICAKHKIGLTGTLSRKDGKEFIMEAIVGSIAAETVIEALTPTLTVVETTLPSKTYSCHARLAWVRALQYLCKDKKRNRLIVDMVIKDLEDGYNIIIPVVYKTHALLLYTMINQAYGSPICEMFIGGGSKKNKEDRKQILTRAKSGKTRVIVGIRSLLQLSLNVPSWSCIYEVIPINNESNLKQETKRVCTPSFDKKEPIIRLFVDMKLSQSLNCAKATIKHCRKFGYHVEEDCKPLITRINKTTAKHEQAMQSDLDFMSFRSSTEEFDFYE